MIPGQATGDVRFAPNSGHKWLWRGMSAFDPKRTLVVPDDLQGGILTVLTDLVQTDNPLNFVCDY